MEKYAQCHVTFPNGGIEGAFEENNGATSPAGGDLPPATPAMSRSGTDVAARSHQKRDTTLGRHQTQIRDTGMPPVYDWR